MVAISVRGRAGHKKRPAAAGRKPNSVPPSLASLSASELRRTTIIPLAPSSLTGSSGLPGGFGRAVLQRLPIWPCSVRGFACHPCYHERGALLPHLFTLTPRLASSRLARGRPLTACPWRSPEGASRRAVSFLCHFPSGCPDRALPGALPCGVRTFLPPPPFGRRRTIVWPAAADSQLRTSNVKLPSSPIILLTDPVLLQLLVQIAARGPDDFRGLRDVPAVLAKLFDEKRPFCRLLELPERAGAFLFIIR